VLSHRNLQNTGVSLGCESIFSKVHRTSTFEHFTVEPQLVQLTWNFVDNLLVCICSQEILFEERQWWFGEAIKYTKVYQMGVVYHSGVDDCSTLEILVYLRKLLSTRDFSSFSAASSFRFMSFQGVKKNMLTGTLRLYSPNHVWIRAV